jgi:hypothetical protein
MVKEIPVHARHESHVGPHEYQGSSWTQHSKSLAYGLRHVLFPGKMFKKIRGKDDVNRASREQAQLARRCNLNLYSSSGIGADREPA